MWFFFPSILLCHLLSILFFSHTKTHMQRHRYFPFSSSPLVFIKCGSKKYYFWYFNKMKLKLMLKEQRHAHRHKHGAAVIEVIKINNIEVWLCWKKIQGQNHNNTDSLLNVLTAAACVCCVHWALNLIPFFIGPKQKGQPGNKQYRVCTFVWVCGRERECVSLLPSRNENFTFLEGSLEEGGRGKRW